MFENRTMRIAGAFAALVLLTLLATPVMATPVTYGGVTFPGGDASFADKVVNFDVGTGVSSTYGDPTRALDPPDYSGDSGYVSLGYKGTLDLQFTNNSLTTSGDSALDLWIFEIGEEVEPSYIWVSQNGSTWISVGSVGGATAGVDLDAYTGSGIVAGALYSYVRIQDKGAGLSGSPWAGADIDAVGAIASAAPVHPVPEPDGLALVAVGLLLIGGMAIRHRRAAL